MKNLLLSIVMFALPIMAYTDSIQIYGDINLRPGGTTTLTVSAPSNSESYTYEWEFDPEYEKALLQYDIIIDNNSVTITHLNLTDTGLLTVTCAVYDSKGNFVGRDEVQILVQW